MTSEDFAAALKRKHDELEELEQNGNNLFTQSKSTASEVIVLISSDEEAEENNRAKVEVESEQRITATTTTTERFITIVKSQPKEIISEDSESEEDDEEEEVDIEYTSNTEEEAEDFTKEESKALRRKAKEMGAVPFLQEQLKSGTPPESLFKAFNFPLPDLSLVSGEQAEVLWSVFYRYLKRFCLIRDRLTHLHSLDHAVELLQHSKNIIVLTGAGISVSCGIPDFRSEGTGLYARIAEKYPDLDDPQLLFDIDYFLETNHLPFYELAREIYPTNFKPSDTHFFIKMLENRGQLLRNYTQNIDTLEHSAGISKVVHCHGSFQTATCLRCRKTADGKSIEAQILSQQVPYCDVCSNTSIKKDDDDDELPPPPPPPPPPLMKPDIIFFGESLPKLFDECIAADRSQVDLLIVIGSSLNVAPVSELIGYFPHSVPIILINREPVYHYHTRFDIQLLGYCDGIVKYLQQKLGWQSSSNFEKSIEIESVEPNVHLFPGHKFNRDRHSMILQRVNDSVSSAAAEDEEEDDDDDYSTD